MDDAIPLEQRLRESRLSQIAVMNAALACIEGIIRRSGESEASPEILSRVVKARNEADALYHLFITGA